MQTTEPSPASNAPCIALLAAVAEAPLRPNPVTQDEMDAGSLTNKLRDNPKSRTTPILILTTESSDRMTAQRGDARRRTSGTTRSTRC